MSEPTSKRKRVDEAEPSKSIRDEEYAPVIARSSIWIEDGNIVLQAEGTQFKVHRSMLSRYSTVFKDMFAVPQPPLSHEGLVEGCAVVQLSDSAEDITSTLRSKVRYVRLDESTPIEVIAAFLRMGRKYDMEVIRVEAQLKLFDAAPITLDAYKPAPSGYALLREAPRWFKILDLSREFEIQSTLPFVFYQCCRILHDSSFFMGVDKANTLSVDSQLVCHRSIKWIMQLQHRTTYKWCDGHSSVGSKMFNSCKSWRDCQDARDAIFAGLTVPEEPGFPPIHGLDTFEDISKSSLFAFDLCDQCTEIAKRSHARGRKEFWDQLPDIFDLQDWNDLKKERDACTNSMCA